VNYNAGGYLKRCLKALWQQDYRDFVAVVVDNGSTDGSTNGLTETFSGLLLITLEKNLGFAAANNLVAMRVTTLWIATLNSDAVPRKDWLSSMMGAAERYPYVDMFGSTLINDQDRARLDGTGDVYSWVGIFWRGNHGYPVSKIPEEGEVFSPCAAAAFYRTEAFQSVGGFDEKFFCYCEDVDLAFRIRLQGGLCIQARNAIVYHYGSLVLGPKSDFAVYHGFRNRLWTFVKNVPSPLFQVTLGPHLLATFILLVKEAASGRGKPAIAGMRDGLRMVFGQVLESRRRIQRSRRASVKTIAEAMTWSPLKMMRRGHDIKAKRTTRPC
jgi:GT2 family glycosyltransferase